MTEQRAGDVQIREAGFHGYDGCGAGDCPTPFKCSERGDCPWDHAVCVLDDVPCTYQFCPVRMERTKANG